MRDYLRTPIVERTTIYAPLERCFALSTRVELVQKTLGMRLVGGVTSGHVGAQSRVLWRGWKFGLLTEHRTLITQYEPPQTGPEGRVAMFEDSQEEGRFARFWHIHRFRQVGEKTDLEDQIYFALPFGPLGMLAAHFLLAPHIRRLARQRFATIKELAEGDGWRQWTTPALASASQLSKRCSHEGSSSA